MASPVPVAYAYPFEMLRRVTALKGGECMLVEIDFPTRPSGIVHRFTQTRVSWRVRH